MGRKGTLLLGLGAGYVLGARAGRERYESLKRRARAIAEDPRVRRAVETARGQASTLLSSARQVATARGKEMTSKVAQKLPSRLTAKLPPSVAHRLHNGTWKSYPETSALSSSS